MVCYRERAAARRYGPASRTTEGGCRSARDGRPRGIVSDDPTLLYGLGIVENVLGVRRAGDLGGDTGGVEARPTHSSAVAVRKASSEGAFAGDGGQPAAAPLSSVTHAMAIQPFAVSYSRYQSLRPRCSPSRTAARDWYVRPQVKVGVDRHATVDDARLDALPLAGSVPVIQRLEHAEERVHGVHGVALAVPVPHGWVAVLARPTVVLGTPERLAELVPARPVGVRAGRSPTRGVAVDDGGVEARGRLVVVLEPLGYPWAQVVMDDVDPGYQLVHDRGAFGGLQVDGERAFPPLAPEERRAAAHGAGVRPRLLDLDDARTRSLII